MKRVAQRLHAVQKKLHEWYEKLHAVCKRLHGERVRLHGKTAVKRYSRATDNKLVTKTLTSKVARLHEKMV